MTQVMIALKIMGIGMLGIFSALILVMLITLILKKIDTMINVHSNKD